MDNILYLVHEKFVSAVEGDCSSVLVVPVPRQFDALKYIEAVKGDYSASGKSGTVYFTVEKRYLLPDERLGVDVFVYCSIGDSPEIVFSDELKIG